MGWMEEKFVAKRWAFGEDQPSKLTKRPMSLDPIVTMVVSQNHGKSAFRRYDSKKNAFSVKSKGKPFWATKSPY